MRQLRRPMRLIAVLLTVTMIGVACGSSKPKSSSSGPTPATTGGSTPSAQRPQSGVPANVNDYVAALPGGKTGGGTVYWAEAPNAAPNYIFPLASAQVCSVANTVAVLRHALPAPLLVRQQQQPDGRLQLQHRAKAGVLQRRQDRDHQR